MIGIKWPQIYTSSLIDQLYLDSVYTRLNLKEYQETRCTYVDICRFNTVYEKLIYAQFSGVMK